MRTYIIAISFSAMAIIASYALEYHFLILPCKLCLMQRYAYFALFILTISLMLLDIKKMIAAKYSSILHIFLFIFTFLILLFSIFHTLLSYGWIDYNTSCILQFDIMDNFEEFYTKIENADLIPCSTGERNHFRILWITIEEWSVIYGICFLLTLFCSMRIRGK